MTSLEKPERVVPNYRIKRILALDDEAPKVNKAAITAIAKAVKIFLSEYAQHIHKHIVDTDSSYPVKVNHIVNVANDPRYIQYSFLSCATRILEATDNVPINEIMDDSGEGTRKRVNGEGGTLNGQDLHSDHPGGEHNEDTTQGPTTGTTNVLADLDSAGKTSGTAKTVDPKKRKVSILQYFKAKE